MRKTSVLTSLGYILLLFIFLPNPFAAGQNKPQSTAPNFELKNGDRVVFLGNSLFENDFQYGYLEMALTTRFPDRNVTFRNLGWTGDNVFGEGRSTFTNPPTPYQHLINNIVKAEPTVIFLAYGGTEAQEGEAGLPKFKDGLNKLIDHIDSLGARTILLSTIPVMISDTSVNMTRRNADLELYASAIAKISADRGKQFIDIYKPIQEISNKAEIIENGVHLNETGYYYLANILENSLGLKSEKETITINILKQTADASANAKILDSGKEPGNLKFTIQENYLPLPLPQQNAGIISNAPVLKITGLKKGFYTLSANNEQVMTASAKEWANGMAIKQGPSFTQAAEIHEMILKKNELHFFQYRPINETYIIGFRAYEQGKHVKDLEDQSILIKWLEGQIALKRMPKEIIYQLSALK
ncbi:GDSL-type esterase/lipase family protein [Dyadobacter sp. NIV53]|uniref:GDSL-type esterase/lipase family protein n=1 Tax=Dyadobacter sp. NIV53 TaxID=2861765 RepID=UPI001C88629E|nr:GDSL-type esterase/lipase family protein [Dyadobacter sp. NIV53]